MIADQNGTELDWDTLESQLKDKAVNVLKIAGLPDGVTDESKLKRWLSKQLHRNIYGLCYQVVLDSYSEVSYVSFISQEALNEAQR